MRFFKSYIVFFVLLCACVSKQNRYTVKPTKSISNPDNELLEVNAVVYNDTENSSVVYLSIDNENLIYKRPDTTIQFYAEMKIKYEVSNEASPKKITDSASFKLLDRADEQIQTKNILSKFKIKTESGESFNLTISVTDENKKTQYTQNVLINRKNYLSRQNFLITADNKVSYKNSFLPNQNVNIQLNSLSRASATVDCFFKEFAIALPPFSNKINEEFKYKPDSSFTISLTTSNLSIKMPETGFYHLRFDPASNNGLSLYTYDEAFPGVSNIKEMILCTRYIMTKQEYETCTASEDQKAAIDKFWLALGGSNERAKELLKRYYNRVKEANKLYTSYNKGWKTDRGMIFIVFGRPSHVYKNNHTETWVYGIESNPSSFRFVFHKEQSPFSNNDYTLDRNQYYKDQWYLAVDYWRQGRIYNVFEK
jgi:GWxTD domain-containing protein